MKNFLKKYWVPILIFLLIIILITASSFVYFISQNTNFLGFVNDTEDINENNSSSTNSDLSTLLPKKLVVPEKYNAGIFATERKINLPKDFKINVFAAGLGKARSFTFDDKNALYLTDLSGRLLYLKDNNNDDIADEISEVEKGLKNPHGVIYHRDDLYLAEEGKISVYRNVEGKSFLKKEIIVSNLPATGGHYTRSLAIGPDQKLYVSIGSSCNLCEEKDKRRASIIRYNLDGSGEEIYAEGLRNSVGIIFNGKDLWSVDNGRDLIGDDLPPEEVNVISEPSKHYGWPYCYGKGINNPEYPNRKDFCQNQTQYPKYEIQAHSAPLGLDFAKNYSETLQLQDNLFVSLHGSWNRTTPTGYKLVRIDTSSSENRVINFATGWLEENGRAWGRPVDIKFDSNGKIFVTDDGAGAVYIIQYEKGCDEKTACVVQ